MRGCTGRAAASWSLHCQSQGPAGAVQHRRCPGTPMVPCSRCCSDALVESLGPGLCSAAALPWHLAAVCSRRADQQPSWLSRPMADPHQAAHWQHPRLAQPRSAHCQGLRQGAQTSQQSLCCMLRDQSLPQELSLQPPSALRHQHATQLNRTPGEHPQLHASPERQAAKKCGQSAKIGVCGRLRHKCQVRNKEDVAGTLHA